MKFAKKEAKRAGWGKQDFPDAPLFPAADGQTFSKRGFAEAAGQIVEENENVTLDQTIHVHARCMFVLHEKTHTCKGILHLHGIYM